MKRINGNHYWIWADDPIAIWINGIGLLIFSRDFQLTRTELPYYSHCSDISHSPSFSLAVNFTNTATFNQRHLQQCWTKPVVDRLLILLVFMMVMVMVAMLPFCWYLLFYCFRFDFVALSSNFLGFYIVYSNWIYFLCYIIRVDIDFCWLVQRRSDGWTGCLFYKNWQQGHLL